jgi:hypothetical protein
MTGGDEIPRWEEHQTASGVASARAWSAALAPGAGSRLGPGDLFLSADTDEVVGHEAVHSTAGDEP